MALLAGWLFIFHNHSVGLEISRLRNIKMLILDVDGVLTDCRIWMDANGEWRRYFSVRDGIGIKRLVENGYTLAIITGSKSEDIRSRVKTLGIHHLYEGHLEKESAFTDLKNKTGIDSSQIAYMGDDFFDVPLLKAVGFAATVPDALEEVKKTVHYVTQRPAGNGAVREVCDYIYQYGFLSQAQSGRTL